MADIRALLPGRRIALAVLVVGLGVALLAGCRRGVDPPPPPTSPEAGDVTAQVHDFCGACHAYPPAETFPRWAWKKEVERGYQFFERSSLTLKAPPIDAVIKYYEDRAPEQLPPADIKRAATPPPVRFTKTGLPWPAHKSPPAVSNINLVHLFDDRRLDVLACDMRRGQVLVLSPYQDRPAWRIVAEVSNPAHVEVVDLDGDGVKDLLVANLGSFSPTDRRCGSVVWLRGNKDSRGKADGTFTPYTLLDNVGRVADVQAADFRGVGKKDLIVAVFGWQTTGEVRCLENQTTDWSKPKFVSRTIDERHGAIHVPVVDLNNDGKPDFIALISQEHETVVAFLNDGKGGFDKKTIYTAPHPGYGSSGIQLVDLNKDGKIDVLYTNGDVLDEPYLLKGYHSIQWLENRGTFPFVHHPLTPMYGVHRAIAADFTGTGKLDVAAVSFLPASEFPQRGKLKLDSVAYLEQTAPGTFARHTLESSTCDHVTCAAGDLFGTGRIDLVLGYFGSEQVPHPVTIWRNEGRVGRK
jgi:hypothetical protein